jgi:exonuclease III
MDATQHKFDLEHRDCLSTADEKDLTIFALNINRLRYKMELLETYISLSLSLGSKNALDVIFLSETFLEKGEAQFFNLEGYEPYHFTRENRSGGGIVFFVRKSIKVSHEVIKLEKREVQMMILNLPELNLKICGIYRPPTSIFSDRGEFLELLDDTLEKNGRMICVGDINIDLLKHESNDLVTVVKSNSFEIINIINQDNHTRCGRASKTIIDHCYSNLQTNVQMQLEETGFSDHKAMILIIKGLNQKALSKTLVKRFTNFNAVANIIKDKSFANFSDFHNFLSETLEHETKIRTKKSNSNYNKPWASDKLKKQCKIKRKFSKLHNRYPDNSYYKDQIRELTILVRLEISHCKKTFYSALYLNNLENSKEVWKISKQIMYNRETMKDENQIELMVDNKLIQDKIVIANVANNFFVQVGQRSVASASIVHEFEPKPVPMTQMSNFEVTTSSEIAEIIKSLENNKACGIDRIPATFLKKNVVYFADILSKYINDSFKDGEFPEALKFAKVKVLHKSGDPKDINNYRPISVLSTISKIFEKVIKNQLLRHLQTNKLIHPSQFGFLAASCTTSAASGLINDIVSGINDKLKTSCIFVDVKKAFDCVNHEVLLSKLYDLGVRGKALKVFQSYLKGRKQVVNIDDLLSAELNLNSGAAQGSVLGPLLFLIYINDLLYLKLNSVGRLFADDAAFVYRSTNYDQLRAMMQKDLSTIKSFLSSINLEMSINKTEFMIFRTNSSSDVNLFTEIPLGDSAIKKVDRFKYLGLVIDSEISWREHTNSIALKIAPFVGLIRRIRPFITEKVAMQLYYAHIHSRLIYCLPVWSSCSIEMKMRLQRLQNKCIKAIKHKPRLTPTCDLYDDKFLSFLQLCDYESILFIHKVKSGQVKCDISLITNESVTNRKTRQSELLRLPRFLMTKSQKSLFYRGVSLYNRCYCGGGLRNDMTISSVKSVIKRFVTTESK